MIVLWAPSGSAKTSLLGTFVTGMHGATGKRARLYNVDGGVDTIRYQQQAGLLDIWDMGNQPYPFESMLDASRGYWPSEPEEANSPLEPPTLVRWIAHCDVC